MDNFEQAANAWFEAKVREVNRKTFRTLSDSMKDGEEITQTFIATRGTEGTGKQGRIDTGTMLDSVESDTRLQGRDEAIGRFGWLSKKPKYAEYQEDGTKYIAPMYALSDAAEIVKQELINNIGDDLRSV